MFVSEWLEKMKLLVDLVEKIFVFFVKLLCVLVEVVCEIVARFVVVDGVDFVDGDEYLLGVVEVVIVDDDVMDDLLKILVFK